MTSRPTVRSPALRTVSLLAALAVATGCWDGSDSTGSHASRTPPSIVVLSLDTLRADHLGSYGYARPTSPRLDAFATESVRFAQTQSQASGTLPSHLSLLTSLNPPHFRITRGDGPDGAQPTTRLRLPDPVTTLAEVLRERGYETLAFTDGGPMNPRYGQDQGFDRYEVNRPRGLRTTIARLGAWLEARSAPFPAANESSRPSPVFIFLHTFDIHEPYRAGEPFARTFSKQSFDELGHSLGYRPTPKQFERQKQGLTPALVAELEALYDNGIAWTDDAFSALLALLARHGLYDDAIVVALSDHGEEFLDHGSSNHGRTLYQEQVHVPLLIRLPEGRHAGRVVEEPVALVDIAPTLLALAGLPVPADFQGASLLDLIEGTDDPARAERPIYFESPLTRLGLQGLRKGRWKLIRNVRHGSVELYDLSEDPGEQHDLADEEVAVREELTARLASWVEEMERSGHQSGWFAVSQRAAPSAMEQETLRALGYVE